MFFVMTLALYVCGCMRTQVNTSTAYTITMMNQRTHTSCKSSFNLLKLSVAPPLPSTALCADRVSAYSLFVRCMNVSDPPERRSESVSVMHKVSLACSALSQVKAETSALASKTSARCESTASP